MVSTRSKTRRASTPLSSPPASSTPSSPSSSEHIEDATADVPPDSPYEVSEDDDDAFDSDHGSDSDHEDYCKRHTSEQATQCHGRTYAGKQCRNRGRIVVEGCLPVCGRHRWERTRAGQCQAIEKCGYSCNRLTAYTPPYFFCAKHERDIRMLPCYIMGLPTELRLMIFRHVLPEFVEAAFFNARQTSVLMVNRQFYLEASAVVYGELTFKAVVYPTTIALFGRRWNRESSEIPYKDLSRTLCQTGARRIRHLEVEVNFGDKYRKIKGIGKAWLEHEDYEMYQIRDTVRKLVQLLSPELPESSSRPLQYLEVKPKPAAKQQWQTDETIAAIFLALEPFLDLITPIEKCALIDPPRPPVWPWRYSNSAETVAEVHKEKAYRRLRKQWLGVLKGALPKLDVPRSAQKATTAVTEAYSKIEDFARVIYNQDASQSQGKASSKYGWTGSSFRGIERVLHIARVAYEDGEIETLQDIHHAIMNRWVKSHAQQQLSLAAVAATISNMFDDVSTIDTYDSKAFRFDEATASEEDSRDDETWPELKVKNTHALLRLYRPDVTFQEQGTKVIVSQDGKDRVWLKTPCVTRAIRAAHKRNV